MQSSRSEHWISNGLGPLNSVTSSTAMIDWFSSLFARVLPVGLAWAEFFLDTHDLSHVFRPRALPPRNACGGALCIRNIAITLRRTENSEGNRRREGDFSITTILLTNLARCGTKKWRSGRYSRTAALRPYHQNSTYSILHDANSWYSVLAAA